MVAKVEEERNVMMTPTQTAARETCTYLSYPERTRKLGKEP